MVIFILVLFFFIVISAILAIGFNYKQEVERENDRRMKRTLDLYDVISNRDQSLQALVDLVNAHFETKLIPLEMDESYDKKYVEEGWTKICELESLYNGHYMLITNFKIKE